MLHAILDSSTLSAATLSTATLAAATDDPARTAGLVFGRLLFFIVGGLLLFFGLRKRSAAQRNPSPKSNGKGLIIAGSIVLGLAVLSLAALSGMSR